MSKRIDLDARRVLELLEADGSSSALSEKLGASPEAIDEARCLIDEIGAAEIDAILAMPPILGRALLRAAAQAGRLDVVVEAAAVGDKELHKEAKRLAHALKHRGVEVELPTKQVEAPKPTTEVMAEPAVYLTSLDGQGERAVYWSRNLPGRGVELAQIVVSDARGVVDFLLAEISRKRFREFSDELVRQGGVTIREVTRDEARIALDRARVAAREGGECPTEFPAWAAQFLGPAPAQAPGPLAPTGEGRPPADPAELGALVADSATILKEPELSRWRPESDALRSFALHLEEALASPLYLSGPQGDLQREEAMAGVVEREAEAYFDPARRARYAGYLLDTARLFESTDRIRQAQIAAAAARMLASDVPSERIPFCRELFARLIEDRQPSDLPSEPSEPASKLILPGDDRG